MASYDVDNPHCSAYYCLALSSESVKRAGNGLPIALIWWAGEKLIYHPAWMEPSSGDNGNYARSNDLLCWGGEGKPSPHGSSRFGRMRDSSTASDALYLENH